MITLGPVKDREYIKNLFCEKGLVADEYSGLVVARDKEEILGLALYELDGSKMTVLYIEPLEDIAFADGILRSTLHVAAERGIMDAFYAETLPEDFLNKLGFIKNRKEKRLDIDKLFKSCCGCS